MACRWTRVDKVFIWTLLSLPGAADGCERACCNKDKNQVSASSEIQHLQ